MEQGIIQNLRKAFEDQFGSVDDTRVFFAPGRVNLIGEHTDYNGGHVFPCALSFGTYMMARKRGDRTIKGFSLNFESVGVLEASMDPLVYDPADNWLNYPKGVAKMFQGAGYTVDSGWEMVLFGNIPNGSGLSSSASVELVAAIMLEAFFNLDMDRVEMVQLCQKAENDFNGVNCGIMDQFAIGMGKENHAVLLDCNTLVYEYAPIELDHAAIVIGNTKVRRELVDSAYNNRRSACERALAQLQAELEIGALGELTEAVFEAHAHLITDPVDCQRAKHAVAENQRTLQAVEALKNKDIKAFGLLMNASHVSLRVDYEVTGKELDTMVELAWDHPGVLGSRMTGAGFGGCTVSIVEKDQVEAFIEHVGKAYTEAIGWEPEFYVAQVGDGAKELKGV